MSEESGTPSFREQAMERMASERELSPPEPAPENVPGEAPDEIGTPEPVTDMAYDDEQYELEAEAIEGSDEIDDSDENTVDEEDHDWQKRYKDLQSEFTRLTQNREEFETEMAHGLTEVKRREYELQDKLTESHTHAEILMNAMRGQADQYRQVNWQAVPADQLPQMKAAADAAFAQEAQVNQALEYINQQRKQQYETSMAREAELTRTRLRKTIPGWGNELYSKIGEYAKSRGLDPQLFQSITNPAVMEMFYDSMQLRSAGSKAKTVSKRRASKPQAQNSPRANRDVRGRFASAKQNFESNPGQKGSFAAMKEAQLRMER